MKRGLLLIVIVSMSINSVFAQVKMASRLVAESEYIYMSSQSKYILNDSVDYTYVGKNGYDSTKQFAEQNWNYSERWYKDFDLSNNIYYQNKNISNYDTFGNIVVVSSYYLDSSQQSSTLDSVGLTVDTLQNKLLKSRHYYDYANNQWNLYNKSEYYWNTNNTIDSFYVYLWDKTNQVWLHNEGRNYTYQNNDLKAEYYLQYNTGISDYDTVYIHDRTYSAGLLTEVVIAYKALGTTLWENDTKYTLAYTGNSLVDTTKRYTWNNINSAWELDIAEIRKYKNSLLDTLLRRVVTGGVLQNDKQYQFTYNSDDLLIRMVSKKWSTSSNQFNDWYINNYYYEKYSLVDSPNNVYNLSNNRIVLDIYPVPARDVIFIHFNTTNTVNVKIYNTAGKLMKETMLLPQGTIKANTNIISVADLPTGSYVIKVSNNSFVESRLINVIK